MTPLNQLSSRQKEVVRLLLKGKSNKQIASSLGISERTVEFHLKNIYHTFQVGSRVELVLKLRESTVAEEGDLAENGGKLNSRNWAESLRAAVSRIGKELKMESAVNSNSRSEGSSMTFFESIRVCLTKYADFDGLATRSEFWWFALFVTLTSAALTYLSEGIASVFTIAVLLPFLAVGARRLHDIGKSGWWLLFMLVPVGGIVLLGFLWATPSES